MDTSDAATARNTSTAVNSTEVDKKAQEKRNTNKSTTVGATSNPEGEEYLDGEEGLEDEELDDEGEEEEDDGDEDDDVDNFTTSEIVTVYVGPKRKRFFLHRELICDRSPFMDKCLKKGHFDEGFKNELYLPEDDTKAFSIIVDWIYRSKIPQRSEPTFDVSDLAAAYCMADKFGMEELQNMIMDSIRASLGRRENEGCRTPHFAALALTHMTGPPKSPLKRFLVEHLVHHMMKHPRWYHDLKRTDPARADVEELTKIPDLVFYIFKKIWQFQAEPWKDPAMWDKCCYHVHASTVCPSKVQQAAVKPGFPGASSTNKPGTGSAGGSGAGGMGGLHGHSHLRPGHGQWPAAMGVWNPGVGW